MPSTVFFGHNDEASLRRGPVGEDSSGYYSLDISLVDDAWVSNISSPVGRPGPGMDLVLGLASDQSESAGWNNIVRSALARTPGVLERVSDTLLRVRLAGFAEYDILSVETIIVSVPGSAVVSARVLEASPTLPIYPVGGSASLSGTCSSVREEVVRSLEACTIDVELSEDAWADGLSTGAAGLELVQGLQAVVPQPGGWDEASRGVLSARSISVIDPTHLSVTVPQMAAFDILRSQEVRLVVPPSAVRSNQGFVSNNTIRILPSAGQAELSGSLLTALDEASLRSGGGASADGAGGNASTAAAATTTLVITLSGDTFVPFLEANGTDAAAGTNSSLAGVHNETAASANGTSAIASGSGGSIDALRLALIRGISSSSEAEGGWNSAVQPLLTPNDIVRVSNKGCTCRCARLRSTRSTSRKRCW